MRLSSLLILLLGFTAPATAAHLNPEKYYQGKWCTGPGWQTEYVLPDRSRVDCLTDTHAVEVEFAGKWQEAVGQSLYYAQMTGKKPAILLIMENRDKDMIYWLRLQTIADKYGIMVITTP